jgi:adenylate cyclase
VTIARSVASCAQRLALPVAGADELPALDLAVETGSATPARPSSDGVERVGERLVTVLFADVRDYTATSGRSAPADVADRIAAMQRWAVHSVEQHHGILDKFAGDAMMATFNASGWHVDHTRHALEVAVGLVSSTARLGLPIGVGIAVGPAIVGRLAEGANVSVLGTATNMAARLQTAARGGEILMSDDAFKRVRDALPALVTGAEQCALELKGFETPVPAFRLTMASS